MKPEYKIQRHSFGKFYRRGQSGNTVWVPSFDSATVFQSYEAAYSMSLRLASAENGACFVVSATFIQPELAL